MSSRPITPGEVASILAEAGVTERCAELPPDLGSPWTHVYLLGDAVVKIAANSGSAGILRERDALTHLREARQHDAAAPSVPRLLAYGDLPDGRSWVVMTRLAGGPPSDAVRPAHELGAPLAGQLGELAARLHAVVAPPGFGTWRRDPGITLVEEHRMRVAAVGQQAQDAGIATPTELSTLAELLAETEGALETAPTAPVLAHRDIQPRNVLVEPSGAVTGLVDFDAAGGGDPAEDFSRVGLDWTTPAFAAFCSGYQGAGGRLTGDASERVTYHVLYWALLIFARVSRHFPGYLSAARLAVQRAAVGDRPAVST